MSDPRESSLPKWAQELIKNLRIQAETALQPAVEARRKLEACEQKCRKLQDVESALHELLFHAAKSGHRTSQEIIGVLESYEIFPPGPVRPE